MDLRINLSVRPLNEWGLQFVTPTFLVMKTKNIIYSIIAKEFKKVEDKAFQKRSTLVNFTNTIKDKIEKKIGDYNASKPRPKYYANKNNGKSCQYPKKSKESITSCRQ